MYRCHINEVVCYVALIGLSSCMGCDSGRPLPTPVRGRITLDGGRWPAAGTLYFFPVEGVDGYPRMPGTAEFDIEGNFSGRTFAPGDGLMPGRYTVRIACWKVVPTMANPAGRSYLPDKYANPETSGLEAVVSADTELCTLAFDVSL
jgi:hypothetical protein